MVVLSKVEIAHLLADVDLFGVQLFGRTKEVVPAAVGVEQLSADKVEELDDALVTAPTIYIKVILAYAPSKRRRLGY